MAILKRPSILFLLSAATLLWTGLSAGWPGPRLRVWELNLERQLLQWRGPRQPPPGVVVVPIDDATLQQGGWFERHQAIPSWAEGTSTLPWPRAAYGQLVERLLRAGAAAVAVNVVFEGSSAKGAADDALMVQILHRHRGRVALAAEMLESEDRQAAGALTLIRPELYLPALDGLGSLGLSNLLASSPLEPLRHPEAYTQALLDAQGLVAPLQSLPTALLRQAGLLSRQPDARKELNLYGPESSFPRLPAWEVLDPGRWQHHPLKSALQGAVVLVGPVVGQPGHPTGFGSLSGLELLATATANSLTGDGLAPWPETPMPKALLAMVPLLAVIGLAAQRSALAWRLGLVAVALGLQLLVATAAFRQANRWVPLLAPTGGLVLLGVIYGGDAYLREGKERQRLRRTFERYVAPSVVSEILSDPAAAQGILRGRLLRVTVLFADLQGFTELTRQRSRAGQTELHVSQLNTYLGSMVEVISAHGGTVDKFIGDAVMAVFGSPVGRGEAEEACQALRCAREMGAALARLNHQWQQQGLVPLSSGIGLASGEVLVGQIGSPRRLDFTVIGDTVNLASRLEALTRRLDTSPLFDAHTADLLQRDFETMLEFGPVSKGYHPIKGLGELEVFALGAIAPRLTPRPFTS